MRILKNLIQWGDLKGVKEDHREMGFQISLHDLKVIDSMLKHLSSLELVAIELNVMDMVEEGFQEEVDTPTGGESDLIVTISQSMEIRNVHLLVLKTARVDMKNDQPGRASMIMMVVTLWRDQTGMDLLLDEMREVDVVALDEEEVDMIGLREGIIRDLMIGL